VTPTCREERRIEPMGVTKYLAHGKTLWMVDEWFVPPGGRVPIRFRQRKIPTKEKAELLLSKKRVEAFEGRFFDRRKVKCITVTAAWELYEPACKQKDAWKTEKTRAACFLRHVGDRDVSSLIPADIEGYRAFRREEKTKRGGPPSDATLDREVELLKRTINYAVANRKIEGNPLAKVKLLNPDNVREVVVTEEQFSLLYQAGSPNLRPIILLAYDTAMRKGSILGLRWEQVNLKAATIRLGASDTKTDNAEVVPLTGRVVEELERLPRSLSGFVFVNPATGERWEEIRKMWRAALKAAELTGVWFHDLRRSAITNMRRRGVPESVAMRISGHKTRAVFERYNIVDEEDLRAAARLIEAGAAKEMAEAKATAEGAEASGQSSAKVG
jgi:integrase